MLDHPTSNNTMDKPMVSVCVQTYNHGKYIKECLDGILMQITSFPFEIILGEDESTDDTRKICIEYAEKNPDKIKLFLRSRRDVIYIGGQATGRFNFLENLKAAKGKYVALCEGDDYWTDPLKLQKQFDFLEANQDFALCFHNANLEYIDEPSQNKLFNSLSKEEFATEDLIGDWFISTASIFYRNYADFALPHWVRYAQSGDIPLLLYLSLRGKIKYLDYVMSSYRLHSAGVSRSHYGNKKILGILYVYQAFNIDTNFKFNKVIENAVSIEIKRHFQDYHKLLDENERLLIKEEHCNRLQKQYLNDLNNPFRLIKRVVAHYIKKLK